jgi:hypothetical protein
MQSMLQKALSRLKSNGTTKKIGYLQANTTWSIRGIFFTGMQEKYYLVCAK